MLLKTLNKSIEKAKTPVVEVESVYKVLPKAHKYVPKTEVPVPRFIWKEKDWPDGFPSSPEEAGWIYLPTWNKRIVTSELKR